MNFDQNPQLNWTSDFLNDFPDSDIFVVGGAVRDELRSVPVKDIDIVITGVEESGLETWLKAHGSVNFVGRTFGVWKFSPYHSPDNPEIDIALPRTETPLGKTGGYKNFMVESDPNLPIEEDLSRRDMTINSMAYSLKGKKLVDPHGGEKDLKERVIRAVGDPQKRFTEDSSRILRALRFAVLINGTIETETWRAIQKLVHRLNLKDSDGEWVVPREVIGHEFERAFLLKPNKALDLYETSGVWQELFSDARITEETRERLKLTQESNFKQHFGEPTPTLLFAALTSTLFTGANEAVRWLKENHLHENLDLHAIRATIKVFRSKPDDYSLAELERLFASHHETIFAFLFLLHPSKDANIWADKLLTVFKNATDANKKPIPHLITGDDLVARKIPEGPLYRILLDEIRSAQIDGKVTNKKNAETLLSSLLNKYDSSWSGKS